MDFEKIDSKIKSEEKKLKERRELQKKNDETFYDRRDAMHANINMVRHPKNNGVKISDEDKQVLKKYDEFDIYDSDEADVWQKNVKEAAIKNYRNADYFAEAGIVQNLNSRHFFSDEETGEQFRATNIDGDLHLKENLEKDFDGISGRSVGKRKKKIRNMNKTALEINSVHAQMSSIANDINNQPDGIKKLDLEEQIFKLNLKLLKLKRDYQHEFVKAYGNKDSWEEERLAQVEAVYQLSKESVISAHMTELNKQVAGEQRLGDKYISHKNSIIKSDEALSHKASSNVKKILKEYDKYKNKNKLFLSGYVEGTESNAQAIKGGKKVSNNYIFEDINGEDVIRASNEEELGGPICMNFMLEFCDIKSDEYKNKETVINGKTLKLTNKHISYKISSAKESLPSNVKVNLDKVLSLVSHLSSSPELISDKDVLKVCAAMAKLIDSTYEEELYIRDIMENGIKPEDYQKCQSAIRLRNTALAWISKNPFLNQAFLETCSSENYTYIAEALEKKEQIDTLNEDEQINARRNMLFKNNIDVSHFSNIISGPTDARWSNALISLAISKKYVGYGGPQNKFSSRPEKFVNKKVNAFDDVDSNPFPFQALEGNKDIKFEMPEEEVLNDIKYTNPYVKPYTDEQIENDAFVSELKKDENAPAGWDFPDVDGIEKVDDVNDNLEDEPDGIKAALSEISKYDLQNDVEENDRKERELRGMNKLDRIRADKLADSQELDELYNNLDKETKSGKLLPNDISAYEDIPAYEEDSIHKDEVPAHEGEVPVNEEKKSLREENDLKIHEMELELFGERNPQKYSSQEDNISAASEAEKKAEWCKVLKEIQAELYFNPIENRERSLAYVKLFTSTMKDYVTDTNKKFMEIMEESYHRGLDLEKYLNEK